ncbi:MAG: EF-hand domain-containing protein, partial [Coprobacillaceae bacterium]
AITEGKIGSYNVAYTYGSGTSKADKAVKITVIADNPEISKDGKTALTAEDKEISDDEAKALVDENSLITINNAVVTFTAGGTDVPNVKVSTADWTAIKAGTVGTYQITYYYGSAEGADDYVEKTVELTVVKRTESRYMFDYNKDNYIDGMDLHEFKRIMSNPSSITEVEKILSDANLDGYVDGMDYNDFLYYLSTPSKKPPVVQVPIN